MSAITDALEHEVSEIVAIRSGRVEGRPARLRARIDRHFSRILALIAPRIRHFIGRYRLWDMAEDAEQACAIGVHRAIEAYDPAKARFTTFVNWQLRGELQGLRHRMRADDRESARRIAARTVSLDALTDMSEPGPQLEIEDEGARARVEADGSAYWAHRSLDRLWDRYADRVQRDAHRRASSPTWPAQPGTIHPADIGSVADMLRRERAIMERYVFADAGERKFDASTDLSPEEQRQISRRVLRNIKKYATEAEFHLV